MDKLADVALEPFKRGVNWLTDSVVKEVDYAWNCKKYVGEVRDAVHQLKEERTRLLRLTMDAEKRGETITNTVEEWLKNTKEFIEKAEEFLTLEESPKMKCCVVMCPNCKTRHQRGRKAKAEMMEEITRYMTESEKFQEISYHEAPSSLSPVKEYESFDSRGSICKNIMEAMSDPIGNKIGLYGINGVGKTTMVKKIANEALEKKLFDEVAMATVFKYHNMKEMQGAMAVLNEQDIRRIQGEIAEGLGFQFHSETVSRRERELRERLKDGKKKLLVLDDIWAKFEMESLGMDELEGCKILMTSINQLVLSQMGSRKNFMLDKLQIDEARDWFNRMAGDVFENPDFGNVAMQVADQCGGLPILLITVAKGLKDNDEINTWNDALEQLSRFDRDDMHAPVSSAIELSYNLLGGDEVKSLFRLCGLINDPIYIDDLLRYAFGLELLTKGNTMKDSRSQLLRIVKKLKDSCLLSEGNNPMEVEMHDTVRSFAISVASRDSVFAPAPYTTLSDWPQENVLRKLTAVSLEHCNIPVLPPIFECPELESFVLSSNDSSLQIPNNFFKGMRKLKVLDLTGINFSQLPSSLQILKDLRTLCLDWCVMEDIKVIGELKRLQILSFSGSDINELPKELQHLSELRLLDLSKCKSIARIEVKLIEVLSSLGKLEELCMEDTILQSGEISTSLAKLRRLSKLDIHITDVKMLPKGNFWEGLKWFKIFIGEGWSWSGEYRTPTTLKIKLTTSIQRDMGLKHLLKNTEDLYLDELKGIKGSVYELDVSGFRQLKHLHVENSNDIQFIVNSTRPCDAFISLESLFLDNLQRLKKICDGPLTPVSFGKLRVLDVGGCGALETVISSSMVGALLRLEEIKIADCKSLKEIITEDSIDDVVNDKAIKLPQLRKLVLHSLPQFLRFLSNVNARSKSQITETSRRSEEIVHETENNTPIPLFSDRIHICKLKELKLSSISIDKIWDNHIPKISSCIQNLTSFTIIGCDKLKYLFSSVMLGSLVNLKTLQVSNCRMIEQIIITEGIGEATNKVTFFPLVSLELENLSELTQVCTSNLFECPALKELSIINCPQLRKFVSNSREKNVTVSNENEATSFSLFDEKVAFSNLEGLTITKMDGVKLIWHDVFIDDSFSKLKWLSISSAEDLVKLFPSSSVLSKFKNVETLFIEDCDSLEDIFGFEGMRNAAHSKLVFKLKMLRIKNLGKLKHIWNKDATEFLSFSNLEIVQVWSCSNLKSIFPSCMAGGLSQLRIINITNCVVEEIVSKEEERESIAYFYFPQLTQLVFWRLQNLKSFYPGHMVGFPQLKCLRVYGCDKMEIFSSESHKDQTDEMSRQQPLFSFEKMPFLEELPLKSNDVKILLDGHFPAEFGNVKTLQLQCFQDESATFPFDLIERFHNLKELCVADSCFKEIFDSNGATESQKHGKNFEKIQVLRLAFLYNLEHIKLENVLNNLRELQVWYCHSLINLAPPSESFKNLKVLEVKYCTKLVSLMAPSTAENLMQLTEMSVENCRMLRDIITNEGDQRKTHITFHKLESLRFDCLISLNSFNSTDCSLSFPLLEEVILKRCPNMTVFSQGMLHVPKLGRVQTEGTDKIPMMESLNATVKHLYEKQAGFVGLEFLDLSEFPQLEGKWPDQLPMSLFDKLKSLIVNAFTIRSSAIPANILPYLNLLHDLKVRDCNSIEEVFGIEQSSAPESSKHLSALTTLELFNLPNLKHLWSESSNKMLNFRKLNQLTIHNCDSLRYIFTLPMLLGLSQLRAIEVKSCFAIREIVAKGEEHDALMDIKFYKLNSITLEALPNLECFYSGRGIVHFPCLTMIDVANCPKAFTSTETTDEKFSCPNLKELRLSWMKMENIWQERVPKTSSLSFQNLTSVIVDGCNNLKYLLLFSIVDIVVNLKSLEISNCEMMKEVIVMKKGSEEQIVLQHLEELDICDLPELTRFCSCNLMKFAALRILSISGCPKLRRFIWNPHGENNIVDTEGDMTEFVLFDEKFSCPNLKELRLSWMKMENIWQERVPKTSSLSFQNLTSVIVDGCNNLKYLLLFSIVDIVVNLKSLEISNCEMMKEVIVMKKGSEEQIVLQHLEELDICDLPELTSFCSCNLMKFPALIILSISGCPKLRRFIWNPHGENNIVDTEGDMTEFVLFDEKFSCPNLKELRLSWMKMENIWQERVPKTSFLSFQNLTSVIVDGCDNLKYLLLFSIVDIVVNLKSLEISNCEMMKEVIVMKKGSEEQIVLQHLEELDICDLPELTSFCSCNLMKFPALRILSISGCPKLRRFIWNPHGENNIVDTEGDMTEFVLFDEKVAFPNLNSLRIDNMDKLKRIWHTNLHENSFCKLSSLFIRYANELLKIFPSSCAQTMLQNLQSLSVINCASLEEVFDTQSLTTQLRDLFLWGLPKLRHIWTKEMLDILSFQNIRSVEVSGCPNLKSLFPVSMAKELRELRRLRVQNCGMVEIISKDREEEAEERFHFPQLTDLQLEDLPELKKFYSGKHTVECPALKFLFVKCDKVDIFKSEQGYLEVQPKITEGSTTFSVPDGQASDIAREKNNITVCSPYGQAEDFVVAGKNLTPSDTAGQASEISAEHETSIKQETSTQFEDRKLAIPTQDSQEISSLKEDKEPHISLQIQKRPQELNQNLLQNEQQPDEVSASFNQQASIVPEFPTAADFFGLSTVANSTMSTSSKESNYIASMPNSETPFQLAGRSFHSPADFESLLASKQDLLKQHQEFSYKPSSSSVTGTDFHNSRGASSENYIYSMNLIKKILKKNLTEVARSTDAHHLLINLINLKNSPILNSHQVDFIQDYIDNFDSLVTNQPFYEQQIDIGTSALVYSIEQKQRSIDNLKAFYQSSNNMSRTLGETKEALKKMLHEIEAEEDRIRATTEHVYADLVAKKGELETDVSVFSETKSRQQKAAEKARKASDSWEKLRNLFA